MNMRLNKVFSKSLLLLSLTGLLLSCQPNTTNTTGGGGDSNDTAFIPDEVYVSEIEITKQPDRLTYVPNEERFDPTGMIVKATWSDGYVEENVPSTKYYFEPSGILTESDDKITIYYGDASTTLNIQTNLNLDLTIEQMPNKIDYTIGEVFDPTGLVLAYYNPDNNLKIAIKDYDISMVQYDKTPLELSDTAVTVTYEDKQIDIPITVRAESIQIELEDQTKVSYFGGTKPKTEILYDVETQKYYRANEEDITYDTYQEAYDAIYPHLTEASKAMLEFASGNDFIAYLDSEDRGFNVNVDIEEAGSYKVYLRGASNDLDNNPPTESYDMNISEKLKMTIDDEEIPISKNAILQGKKENEPNYHLFTNWYTAYLATIDLKEGSNTLTFTTFGDGTPTSDKISWKCYGQYDYILFEKTEKHTGEIEDLSIDYSRAKTAYHEGEVFSPVGLKVVAKYKDGYEEEIYDFTYPTEPLTRENSHIEIAYGDKKASIPLTIKKVTGLEISEGYRNTYVEGEVFDASNLVVKATFEDGVIDEDFKLYDLSVDNPLTTSSSTFTVTYFDIKVNGEITVNTEEKIQLIEFEDANYVSWTGNEISRKSSQNPTHWMLDYASGKDFLCGTNAGAVLTVKIHSSKARKANLTIRASSSFYKENPPKELFETKMNEIVDIMVNETDSIDLTDKVLPGKKAADPNGDRELFVYFADIDLGDIDLKAGSNIITFTFKNPNNYTNCFQKSDKETPQDACGQYDSLTLTLKD